MTRSPIKRWTVKSKQIELLWESLHFSPGVLTVGCDLRVGDIHNGALQVFMTPAHSPGLSSNKGRRLSCSHCSGSILEWIQHEAANYWDLGELEGGRNSFSYWKFSCTCSAYKGKDSCETQKSLPLFHCNCNLKYACLLWLA